MRYELFLAFKYMRGNRHTLGGALTSFIAIGGVTVAVAALITTLAVMTGFREDIRAKILGAQPHIMVMGSSGTLPVGDWAPVFKDVEEVEAFSPYVMGQALIKRGGATQGIIVKGIDPERERLVTVLSEHVSTGNWESLSGNIDGKPAILLGRELANNINADVGDEVLVAVPAASPAALMGLPGLYPFTVGGIVQTGLYDYDTSLTVVSLPSAQALFGLKDKFSGLGVRVKDPDNSLGAAIKIQKNVGGAAWARSWLALNHNLFAALKLEKIVMFLILTLITLVAAFTIVSNLILVTAQKVREIGILRAMGASRRSIELIFLIKGLVMGLLGTAAGTVLGLGLSGILKKYQFIKLPADVYYVETLPVKIVTGDVLLVVGAALLIVLLASLYPSRLAAKLDALTAIREQ